MCRYTWEIYAERLMTLSRVYRQAGPPHRCDTVWQLAIACWCLH